MNKKLVILLLKDCSCACCSNHGVRMISSSRGEYICQLTDERQPRNGICELHICQIKERLEAIPTRSFFYI